MLSVRLFFSLSHELIIIHCYCAFVYYSLQTIEDRIQVERQQGQLIDKQSRAITQKMTELEKVSVCDSSDRRHQSVTFFLYLSRPLQKDFSLIVIAWINSGVQKSSQIAICVPRLNRYQLFSPTMHVIVLSELSTTQ